MNQIQQASGDHNLKFELLYCIDKLLANDVLLVSKILHIRLWRSIVAKNMGISHLFFIVIRYTNFMPIWLIFSLIFFWSYLFITILTIWKKGLKNPPMLAFYKHYCYFIMLVFITLGLAKPMLCAQIMLTVLTLIRER